MPGDRDPHDDEAHSAAFVLGAAAVVVLLVLFLVVGYCSSKDLADDRIKSYCFWRRTGRVAPT